MNGQATVPRLTLPVLSNPGFLVVDETDSIPGLAIAILAQSHFPPVLFVLEPSSFPQTISVRMLEQQPPALIPQTQCPRKVSWEVMEVNPGPTAYSGLNDTRHSSTPRRNCNKDGQRDHRQGQYDCCGTTKLLTIHANFLFNNRRFVY